MRKLYLYFYLITITSFAQTATIDNNFNPQDTGVYKQNIGKYCVSIPNEQLLSIHHSTQNINKILRLNSDGSIDPTFNFTETSTSLSIISAKNDGAFVVVCSSVDNISDKYAIKSFNADGTPNTAFTSPVFTIDSGYTNTLITDIKYQNDGKIIIVGYFKAVNGTNSFDIIRLNNNGSIDTTFNSGGTGFYFLSGDYPSCVTLQSDGKYIVGGSFTMYNGIIRPKLIRLLSNGAIDTGFASFTNSSVFIDDVTQVVVQPDGKIIANGGFTLSTGIVSHYLTRFNSNGVRDTSFIDNYSSNSIDAKYFCLQSDGKILITKNNTKIERHNANNSTDNTFVDNNLVGNGIFNTIFIHNQKILVNDNYRSANGVTRFGIHKLNMNGSLDTSFNPPAGSNLMFDIQYSGFNNDNVFNGHYSCLKALNDGSILVLADVVTTYNDTPVKNIFKLTESGLLDTSFNIDPSIEFTNLRDRNIIKVQNDGKIVICATNISSSSDYSISNIKVNGVQKAMIRINQNGSLDTTFNFNYITNNPVYDFDIQSDNKFIVVGTGNFFISGTKYKLVRLNSDATVDPSYTSQLFFFPVSKLKMQNNDRPLILANNLDSGISGSSNYRIYRLTNTGALETSFNAVYTFPGNFNFFKGLSNDKIIARRDTTIYRVNALGTVDATFSQISSSGKIVIDSQNKIYIKEATVLKRYSENGTLEDSFPINTGSATVQIQLHGCDKMLVSSYFEEISGLKKNNIVQYNLSSNTSTTNAPTGVMSQPFITGQTLADLIVVGQNILWYSNQSSCIEINGKTTLDVALPLSTPLVSGTTYYASQTINGIESVYRLPITVNQTLGLNENALDNLKIFPNPVHDFVQIQSQKPITKIEFYNAIGQKVITHSTNTEIESVDLTKLNSGIYILKIFTEVASKSFKIIKE